MPNQEFNCFFCQIMLNYPCKITMKTSRRKKNEIKTAYADCFCGTVSCDADISAVHPRLCTDFRQRRQLRVHSGGHAQN